MTRPRACLAVAAVVCAAVFGSSFVFAPHSCEGGLDGYLWVGVAALVVLLVLPFIARSSDSMLASAGWSLGLVLLGIVSWIGGFAAAPFRIVCRLF